MWKFRTSLIYYFFIFPQKCVDTLNTCKNLMKCSSKFYFSCFLSFVAKDKGSLLSGGTCGHVNGVLFQSSKFDSLLFLFLGLNLDVTLVYNLWKNKEATLATLAALSRHCQKFSLCEMCSTVPSMARKRRKGRVCVCVCEREGEREK